jgi:hypothetical protein
LAKWKLDIFFGKTSAPYPRQVLLGRWKLIDIGEHVSSSRTEGRRTLDRFYVNFLSLQDLLTEIFSTLVTIDADEVEAVAVFIWIIVIVFLIKVVEDFVNRDGLLPSRHLKQEHI